MGCWFAPTASAQDALQLMEKARAAYRDYNFSEATRLLNSAHSKLPKGDVEAAEWYSKFSKQLSGAKNYLNRVEDIEIIGMENVSRDAFFKAYRIPSSAGYLEGESALPYRQEYVDYVFTNESEDYKLWAAPDSTGRYQIVESSLLTDGHWSRPTPIISTEGDAIYPFMMADGVTLYYADNGPGSIGGYDIMVATRDASDGKFLQPSNLGFPYNSPYDDYLLAIDELNGIGWWASERNNLEDEVTIYYFVTNDMRRNYDADHPDILELARLRDIEFTFDDDRDVSEYEEIIAGITPGERNSKAEFYLPAPGGKIYTRYSDLPSAESRARAKQYFEQAEAFEKMERELRELRRSYHTSKTEAKERKILKMETEVDTRREALAKVRNQLYKTL